MTTSKTTRRAVLAGSASALAACTSLSATAIDAAQAAVPLNKMTLGEYSVPGLARAFEALYQRWKFQLDLDAAARDAFYDFVHRRTGVRYVRGAEIPAEFREQFTALSSEWGAGQYDPDLQAWDKIHDELHALSERIMWQPIRSIADLVLAARITAVVNNEWWSEELEYSAEWMPMALVSQILHMAGVEKFPEVEAPTALEDFANGEAEVAETVS